MALRILPRARQTGEGFPNVIGNCIVRGKGGLPVVDRLDAVMIREVVINAKAPQSRGTPRRGVEAEAARVDVVACRIEVVRQWREADQALNPRVGRAACEAE